MNKVKLIFASVAFIGGYLLLSLSPAHAATNISATSTEHFAWNDLVGWIDFYNTDNVVVSSRNLVGYASSSAGDVSLDCHTTRIGNICGASNYQVTNDGMGNLSGWGWNDSYGWISFDCHNTAGCGSSSYQVYADPSTGIFSNYAWNDLIGWISFNCANTGSCATSNYKVATSWFATSAVGYVDSTTYDTGVALGAQLNSFIWHGAQPAGTYVKFQFAASNSPGGPWTYYGPGGSTAAYYGASADTHTNLEYSQFNNYRYFRYRTTLVSNQAQTLAPRVDEVSINWSP